MAGLPARTGAERRGLSPRWLGAGGLLVALSLFLGFDVASHPIVLWDESRLAVNALEMSQRGFSLVTTYGFAPDLWNTKPPLLIWLEAASIDLFGANEMAVRLPSLLAAVATLAIVMRFSWRISGSAFVAAAAAVMLALSRGFFAEHAADSGDYDAPLTLFTTGYVLLLFETLHQRRPHAWKVLACGLLVAAACLTKGVAGLVPGVGIAVYALVRGRLTRLFRTPWYLLAGLIAVALVGAYYLLRERAAPGYLAAVTNNELGGRYVRGMPGHIGGALYYLQMVDSLFAFGPAFLLVFAAGLLRMKPGKAAAFLTYANVVAAVMLIVFSLSRTKIFWYIVPVYPLLSMSFAIVARRALAVLRRPGWPAQLPQAIVLLAVIYLVTSALTYKLVVLPSRLDFPQGRYGLVYAALDRAGLRRVETIDGGVANDDSLVDYTPQRRFYTLAWRARGFDIREEDPNAPPTLHAGWVLVTCDPLRTDAVSALGAPAASVSDCAAVRSPVG